MLPDGATTAIPTRVQSTQPRDPPDRPPTVQLKQLRAEAWQAHLEAIASPIAPHGHPTEAIQLAAQIHASQDSDTLAAMRAALDDASSWEIDASGDRSNR